MLILPGDPEFDVTLSMMLPPNSEAASHQAGCQVIFAAEAGSGILRPLAGKELEEYLYGGEYDERMEEIGDWDLV